MKSTFQLRIGGACNSGHSSERRAGQRNPRGMRRAAPRTLEPYDHKKLLARLFLKRPEGSSPPSPGKGA